MRTGNTSGIRWRILQGSQTPLDSRRKWPMMLPLGYEEIMSIQDFYWMPSAGVVTYEWWWLYGHRRTLKPFRTRAIAGIVGLVLATVATLGLLTVLVDNCFACSFTLPPPSAHSGVLLHLAPLPLPLPSKAT